ncbi:MAG: hypothetical protein H6622_03530 [Halobacteriovoraceae bacterium]|nr:hypothetical protein [Halobacteriovoraceae bacterium]
MRLYIIILLFILNPAFADEIDALGQRQLTTTRLQSTGGAGIGSLLLDEATILNPAALTFFNITNIYYQRSSSELKMDEVNQLRNDADYSNLFVLTDASGTLKGSALYSDFKHNNLSRRSIGGSISSAIGKVSSFGVSYLKTQFEGIDVKDQNTLTFGVTHVITENLTSGAVIVNPFSKRKEEQSIKVGFQYFYLSFITLMLDIGTKYRMELDKNFLYAAAIQFKIFSDFFLKFGTFKDQGENKKGNGIGILWAQPKLSFGFSINQSKNIEPTSQGNIYNQKETSFSVSYRF